MLIDQIKDDTIQAMRDKDVLVLNVLRLVNSEVKNYEINELRVKGLQLTDEDVIKVLHKEAKKRKESIEIFTSANRMDLADKETAELRVLERYIPKQMSREDVEKTIDEVLAELFANKDTKDARVSPNFGEIMKTVMPKLGGQADGKLVSEIVKEKIN